MKNVMYSKILENGGTLVLPPDPDYLNFAQPTIHKVDTAQQYDIGTKYEYNGKVYHYAYGGGTIIPDVAVKIKDPQSSSNEVLGAAAAAYATSISVTFDSTDGATYNGRVTKDYLKGGVVVVFPAATNKTFTRGILRNTAITTAGGVTVLTLDSPIPNVALTTSDTAETQCSPWANVVPNTATKLQDNLCSHAGVAMCPATVGQWLWVQTWGLCWIAPDAALGAGTNNRDARFNGDGSISDGDDTNTTVIAQHAGWVVANDKGAGQGAPFIYLQIAR